MKMNYSKVETTGRLRQEHQDGFAKKAHMQALRKAWALWKQGKGPRPVWNAPAR